MHDALADVAVKSRAMSNAVMNVEPDYVLPDMTTAERKRLVADSAARETCAKGSLQMWDANTVARYDMVRQREDENRYCKGSREQVARSNAGKAARLSVVGRRHLRVCLLLRNVQ